MHVKTNQESPTKLTFTITADSADLDVIKQEALKTLAKTTKVAGFRDGKAPLSVIEKNADDQQLQSIVVDEAINKFYIATVKKTEARPVGAPQVTLKKFVPYTELEFDATTDAVGKIELPNYKTMKKELPKAEVTADEVNKVLDDLLTKASEKKDVNREAKDGDQVIIDFKGTDDKGESISGADGTDYPLLLGSKTFIPGFEENLIGLKAKDKKTFKVTFPKDYGVKALASKEVEFSVSVKNVQELVKPKLDDDFAKKLGPFEDIKALKKDVKAQLLQEKQSQARNALENAIIGEIVEKSKVDLPETLVAEQQERLKQEVKQNIMYRGQTWKEMLELEGMTEEDYDKTVLKPEADARVKTALVMSEISHIEKVVVTPEELDFRMQLLKGQYTDPTMQAELEKPEAKQDIASRMITEKTLDLIVKAVTKK